VRSRGVALAAPAFALCALHAAATATLFAVTGGREIADDAPHLLRFVREPFLLFASPEASGLPSTWASFPPLLPPLFGALVRPWLAVAPEFVAIRAGVLLWTLAALAALHAFAARSLSLAPPEARRALWLYTLVPLPLLASALLPQEEAYVSLFAVGLAAAALAGRTGWVAAGLAATALAGKVFLLLLAVPLAFAGPAPFRTLALYGAAGAAALGAYLGFHQLAHGSMPLLGYRLDPVQGVSIWSLLRLLGVPLDASGLGLASVAATGAASLAFCAWGRRRRQGLVELAAGTLWIAQIGLSVAMPPYLLWNLPFLAVYAAPSVRRWRVVAAALVAWTAAAYGAKGVRGVALALETPRGEGKGAVAALFERFLGRDFPYDAAQLTLTALCLAIGTAFTAALLIAPGRSTRSAADEQERDRAGNVVLRGEASATPDRDGGTKPGHASGAR
jgi:hypothetical protein